MWKWTENRIHLSSNSENQKKKTILRTLLRIFTFSYEWNSVCRVSRSTLLDNLIKATFVDTNIVLVFFSDVAKGSFLDVPLTTTFSRNDNGFLISESEVKLLLAQNRRLWFFGKHAATIVYSKLKSYFGLNSARLLLPLFVIRMQISSTPMNTKYCCCASMKSSRRCVCLT